MSAIADAIDTRHTTQKPFLGALAGERQAKPPLWLMRQAGRYLPEYRETRAKANGFLDLCYNPELACEVTLQPLRRYPLDAAILFADILLIPHALGRKLEFLVGEGPKLEPLEGGKEIARLDPGSIHDHLSPVYETVERITDNLDPHTALIGFAGSPWTVACYMVEGESSRCWERTQLMASQDKAAFSALMDVLVEATSAYLIRQIEAGAEAVQLFDSWAGTLSAPNFKTWCIEPTRRIVDNIRAAHPHVPVIGFPRGAGVQYETYFRESGVTAIGIDQGVPVDWAAKHLQPIGAVQGNLDPLALLAGGEALESAANQILDELAGGPHIFNLGHGVVPPTPPEHVARLCEIVTGR